MFDKHNETADQELMRLFLELQKELDATTDAGKRTVIMNQMKLIFEMRKLNAEGDAKRQEAEAKIMEAKAKEAEVQAKVNVSKAEYEKLKAEERQIGKIDKNQIIMLVGLIIFGELIMHHEETAVITSKAFSFLPVLARRV